MNIKTWSERAESLSDDTVVTSLHLAQFRQAEIDELRSENAQLKTDLETWKSNHARLKAMVDDGSIADRTYSASLELERENARLRDALADIAYGLEGSRIWGGMEWSYAPLHPFKYLPLRDKARAALGGKP